MHKIIQIFVIFIVFSILAYLFKKNYSNVHSEHQNENFKVNSQNYVNNNAFDVSNSLNYNSKDDTDPNSNSNSNSNLIGLYKNKSDNPMGPSQNSGVGQNSNQDIYDNRGFNWSANSTDAQVDTFTKIVDDAQLRNKFERTYMLDPDGSVAQYDLTYNKVSPNCCPAQYSPPFKISDKNSTNCDFAQKYVANQYSGMNFNDGYGCVCVTPKQADFFGSRGGNTD